MAASIRSMSSDPPQYGMSSSSETTTEVSDNTGQPIGSLEHLDPALLEIGISTHRIS
jgi:hypothetical protein